MRPLGLSVGVLFLGPVSVSAGPITVSSLFHEVCAVAESGAAQLRARPLRFLPFLWALISWSLARR